MKLDKFTYLAIMVIFTFGCYTQIEFRDYNNYNVPNTTSYDTKEDKQIIDSFSSESKNFPSSNNLEDLAHPYNFPRVYSTYYYPSYSFNYFYDNLLTPYNYEYYEYYYNYTSTWWRWWHWNYPYWYRPYYYYDFYWRPWWWYPPIYIYVDNKPKDEKPKDIRNYYNINRNDDGSRNSTNTYLPSSNTPVYQNTKSNRDYKNSNRDEQNTPSKNTQQPSTNRSNRNDDASKNIPNNQGGNRNITPSNTGNQPKPEINNRGFENRINPEPPKAPEPTKQERSNRSN